MIRFIHCADLHFDRSFEGLSLLADHQTSLVAYNQLTLKNIVDYAIDEEVDFVLFAGDTFHQNRPTLKTQRLFFEQMKRLSQKEIPVYLCFGNHDYYEEERYWFEFPDNVHIFKEETVTTFKGLTRTNEQYAISAFSYRKPWIDESKVAQFPDRYAVNYHIAMYHGEIGKNRYAPFQPQEMLAKGYDYWALGHIHVPTVVQTTPPLIYPGTPTGHSKKEEKTSGVALVTLSQNQSPEIEYCQVAPINWQSLEISLRSVRTLKEVVSFIRMALKKQIWTTPSLVQIRLLDSENLPVDWLNKAEKQELLYQLVGVDVAHPIWIYDLIATQHSQENNEQLVAFSPQEIAQRIAYYQDEAQFREGVRELWTQPILTRMLQTTSFKDEVIRRVEHRLEEEIGQRGEREDANFKG